MNLDDLNPINQKFEPGRTVFVLLSKDHTHIYPNPDGMPAWSYDPNGLSVIHKILRTELGNHNYDIVELAIAFPLICNKQAELEKLWKQTLHRIQSLRSRTERIYTYRRFYQKHKQPHPISADALLRNLLGSQGAG